MEDVKAWLSPTFWHDTLRDLIAWSIATAPRLLIISIGAWVILKMYKLGMRRLQVFLSDRPNHESAIEHGKRVNTLIGIVNKVGQKR